MSNPKSYVQIDGRWATEEYKDLVHENDGVLIELLESSKISLRLISLKKENLIHFIRATQRQLNGPFYFDYMIVPLSQFTSFLLDHQSLSLEEFAKIKLIEWVRGNIPQDHTFRLQESLENRAILQCMNEDWRTLPWKKLRK